MKDLKKQNLNEFIKKYNLSRDVMAQLCGVTAQAVRLWSIGDREVPEIVFKCIKVWNEKPELMNEWI